MKKLNKLLNFFPFRKIMNHKMLCDLGSKWLKKKGFSIILEKMVASTSTGEQPYVLGFKNGYSVLLEAKFSRGDFLKDKDKFFRKKHDKGVGNYRLYICPTNLIAKEELPEGWGLLYVNENLKVEEIIEPKGNSFKLEHFNGDESKASCFKH